MPASCDTGQTDPLRKARVVTFRTWCESGEKRQKIYNHEAAGWPSVPRPPLPHRVSKGTAISDFRLQSIYT